MRQRISVHLSHVSVSALLCLFALSCAALENAAYISEYGMTKTEVDALEAERVEAVTSMEQTLGVTQEQCDSYLAADKGELGASYERESKASGVEADFLAFHEANKDLLARCRLIIETSVTYSPQPIRRSRASSYNASLPDVRPNAYGLGVNSDEYGRPHIYRTEQGEALPGIFNQGVKRDAYGLGVHSDQFGRPVYDSAP